MTRRAVRFVLLLSLVAGVGAATYLMIEGERQAARTRRSAQEFDLTAARLQQRVREISAGQQAYVAPGQDPAWWRRRVGADLATLQQQLDHLRGGATNPGALAELDAAVAGAEALREVDARTGRFLADDAQKAAASLIYGEALATAADTGRRIESARVAELQAFDHALDRTRRRATESAGAAGLLAVTIGLLLLPTGSPRTGAAPIPDALPHPEEERREPVSRRHAAPVEVHLPEPAAPPQLAGQVVPAPAEPVGAPRAEPDPKQPQGVIGDRRRAPELRAAADLCTDFARLVDGQELPALLERASQLLDATGLIVWVADPDGTALRPVFAQGYTGHALSRLPAIPRDADNATAAAYRESRLEVVKTNGMSPGAIVAPLITPSGCLGVVAAEVRHGREASESARALARIVAAQLATLVSVAPGQEHTTSHSAVG